MLACFSGHLADSSKTDRCVQVWQKRNAKFCNMIIWSFIKRQTSSRSSDNEWQRVTMSGTTSDKEWQRVKTSDKEWQRVIQQVTEWKWVIQRVTTNGNEWLRVTALVQRMKMAQYTSKNGWLPSFQW